MLEKLGIRLTTKSSCLVHREFKCLLCGTWEVASRQIRYKVAVFLDPRSWDFFVTQESL